MYLFSIYQTSSATSHCVSGIYSQIARFMGPTWGAPGSCRPQMGPMLAPWTLLLGFSIHGYPDSKVHGANIGPIWGRQDPDGPHVGPMHFVIWVSKVSASDRKHYIYSVIDLARPQIKKAPQARNRGSVNMILIDCACYPNIDPSSGELRCNPAEGLKDQLRFPKQVPYLLIRTNIFAN